MNLTFKKLRKKFKKNIGILTIFMLMLSFLVTGCSSFNGSKSEAAKKPIIGVVVGKFDDTWRTSVRNEIYKMSEGNLQVDIWNSNDSQETQNKQIDTFISRKVNVLAVNLVDATAAASIIDKAKTANIPVIFFNTEPSEADLAKYDKAYYVGANGEQSGTLQGQILVDYFKNKPTSDGVIHYVMLKGPNEHNDAISRTKYSIKAIEDAGLKVEKVADDIGSWDRDKANGIMDNFLNTKSNIDCVIANNDDMALGAIDALKTKGYFSNGKYMPVVGVDDTSSAANAIKNGTLLGSVLNDAENQGKAIYNLANVLAKGQTPNDENCGYKITNKNYIWIDYKMITKENVDNKK